MIVNLNQVKYIELAPEEGWVSVYFIDGTIVPTPAGSLKTYDGSSPGQMGVTIALNEIAKVPGDD